LEKWYENYESQCWYNNTYLIKEASNISYATIDGKKCWNNINDSGCHFVCLAMIIGINPAYLSSALGENKNYFKEDTTIDSLYINGTEGSLIWDQNKPDKENPEIELKNIFHPKYGLTDVVIKCIDIKKTNNENKANSIINTAHSNDMHVICGYEDHSRLVAGINCYKYFLWDPDTSSFPDNKGLKNHLNGEYNLEKFYSEYEGWIEKEKHKEEIGIEAEYWIYSVKYSHFG